MIKRCDATGEKKTECLTEIENYLRIKYDNNGEAIKHELEKIKQEAFSNCSEEIEGIDIRTYLNTISNYKNEGWLVIAVQENKVLEVLCFEGLQENRVEFSNQQMESLKSFIRKWNSSKAKLYQYHNHPNRLAAEPSNDDIENPPYKLKENINEAKKSDSVPKDDLEKLISSEGIVFEDIGVVTKLDFCSFGQIGAEKLREIMKKNDRKSLNTCNEGFKAFGITDDMDDE